MKQYQKGEVMLELMVVMMVVIWMASGHIGMMGHGGDHAEKPAETEKQQKTEPPLPPAPKESLAP